MVNREFFFGAFGGEWLVCLAWEAGDKGKVYFVTFTMFEVRTWNNEVEPEPRLYGDDFTSVPRDPDVYGNVKWDGCTDFHFGNNAMHVCDGVGLALLFNALAEVRRVALDEVMTWSKER